jgi:hypothetical protein
VKALNRVTKNLSEKSLKYIVGWCIEVVPAIHGIFI